MNKDENFSVQVTWIKDGKTNIEIANNHPLNEDEAKIFLQRVKKTVFPKGTTTYFEIVSWKQNDIN